MSEMLERVARILEPQAWRALGLCDTLAYKNRRTSSLRKARAAIEAMRRESDVRYDGLSIQQLLANGVDANACWNKMIDIALAEPNYRP